MRAKRFLALLLSVLCLVGTFAVAASAASYVEPAKGIALVADTPKCTLTNMVLQYKVPDSQLDSWKKSYAKTTYTWAVTAPGGLKLDMTGNRNIEYGIMGTRNENTGLFELTVNTMSASTKLYGKYSVTLTLNFSGGARTSKAFTFTLMDVQALLDAIAAAQKVADKTERYTDAYLNLLNGTIAQANATLNGSYEYSELAPLANKLAAYIAFKDTKGEALTNADGSKMNIYKLTGQDWLDKGLSDGFCKACWWVYDFFKGNLI